MFMIEAMSENGQMCYQEFHMYPPMLRHFAHVLQDEHRTRSSQQVDIYEQVNMFPCVLAIERVSASDYDIQPFATNRMSLCERGSTSGHCAISAYDSIESELHGRFGAS